MRGTTADKIRGWVVTPFDAFTQKSHAALSMKFALSLLVPAVVTCFAIANAAEPGVRSISREECIRMALSKNLDIRLSRIDPEMTKINLWGDVAAWDPKFDVDLEQRFSTSEGSKTVGEFNPTPNERWSETFTTGVSGLAPWGLEYRLGTTVARSSGIGSRLDPNTGQLIYQDSGFFYSPTASIQLTQPLLKDSWIDGTRLQIQLDRKGFKQNEADVRGQIMRTVSDVETAYFDLIYKKESIKVQQKALETAERFLAEQKKRVEIGALAPLDEKKAESQVARLRTDLLDAEASYSLAQNLLKSLVSDDFGGADSQALEPVEALSVVPTAFSKIDSWNKGLSNRPEIQRSKLELERQKIRIQYRRNQLFPELDIRGGYGVLGADDNFGPAMDDLGERRNPNHNVGIRLSMPLSNRRERANMKSAKLENERLLLRHKQLEQSIIRNIDDAILAAKTSLARIDSTKAERVYAEAALEAEQKKLENGKSTGFFVLELQRDLTTARSNEIRAQSDYNKALIKLSREEGSTLDSAGVRLDFR
jgi:outer membrane protein TolC